MTTAKNEPIAAGKLTTVPANKASWNDLLAVFGTADYPSTRQVFHAAGSSELTGPTPRRVVMRIDFR